MGKATGMDCKAPVSGIDLTHDMRLTQYQAAHLSQQHRPAIARVSRRLYTVILVLFTPTLEMPFVKAHRIDLLLAPSTQVSTDTALMEHTEA